MRLIKIGLLSICLMVLCACQNDIKIQDEQLQNDQLPDDQLQNTHAQTISSSTWQSVTNTEFCNLDVWCGSGLYFYEKDNIPYCTYMIYGSGVYVAYHYTTPITITSEGIIDLVFPEKIQTAYLNDEPDLEKPIDIQLIVQDQEIIWGNHIFTIGPYQNSFEHILNWDEQSDKPTQLKNQPQIAMQP